MGWLYGMAMDGLVHSDGGIYFGGNHSLGLIGCNVIIAFLAMMFKSDNLALTKLIDGFQNGY